MRKIESQLHEAIRNFKPFHKDNTLFTRDAWNKGKWTLYLHGNAIASFDENGKNPTIPTYVSLAGWDTKNTCSRLNSLDGVHICHKNFIPYLNGREIDLDGWWDPSNLTH